MHSKKIRKSFLKFFEKNKHKIVPSSPVIPHEDPTLLFVNAGMNQFKDVFLGKGNRDYLSAANTQKCIRVGGKHNDLENVGHTTRHLTFFEMLGNFSFGDYFKKEAIAFAWDVALNVFELPEEKLWASVYKKDDESYELWKKFLPETRIVRLGEKDNFWEMGEVGPCGPCSELLYDRGEKFSKATNPEQDLTGERFFEFWNLVFMESEKDEKGNLHPLPKKCIDTGAGLERVVALKMGVENIFETDILKSLIDETATLAKKDYTDPLKAAFHVIADHIRALSFAIADGAMPSNTARGYVLRKIIRRASRYGKGLGLTDPFLYRLVPKVCQLMGEDFPELISAEDKICEVLEIEEINFLKTLQRGGNLLQKIIEESKAKQQIQGEDAFRLKDTYGFPIEEILLIAKDANLQVDLDTYETLEKKAKLRSQQSQKKQEQKYDQNLFEKFLENHSPTKFLGHEKNVCNAKILKILKKDTWADTLEKEQDGAIILDQTTFYAEMGGQVGDDGILQNRENTFSVFDCISPYPGIFLHIGKVLKGSFHASDKVEAGINAEKRQKIRCNQSATHLLHGALEHVLGQHIRQAGSLVEETRLRFDFSHHKALTKEQINQIEKWINQKIQENLLVKTYEMAYEKATKDKQIKQFFGDKYGKTVRVIDMDFSKELCGGTHVSRLGEIGMCKITKETSVAAGIRRMEAVTAKGVESWIYQMQDFIESISATLKCSSAKILEKIDSLLLENETLKKEHKNFQKLQIKQHATNAIKNIETINGISFIALEASFALKDLSEFAEEIMHHMPSGILAVGLRIDERCQFFIRVSEDLVEKKIYANTLIQEILPIIEGGGGGKKITAQAGGKNPSKIPSALIKIRQIIEAL